MPQIMLDIQYFSGEKTEKATPKKRQDSREKGQVAKSADLSTAVSLLAMFLLFIFALSSMGQKLYHLMGDIYEHDLSMPLNEHNIQLFFNGVVKKAAIIVMPVLLAGLIVGVSGHVIQIGFLFSSEAIQFKPDRINPLKGFKRIYSLRAIVELMKSILKIGTVGFITFFVIWMNRTEIILSMERPLADGVRLIGKITLEMGFSASIFLMFLAIMDFMYQKFDFEKNIRMSKQEVKDEYKKTEGDPLIKSKIKEKQRQMAMRRMMQELPKADVVITNPTHYAVALKYVDGKMDAPVVLAKGADYLALKIREIANGHDVMIVEKRPLARALYHQLEIGDPVPESFFKAVAEILAYVYKLKGKA
ncbi:flagellar biosynthetic protein FlhB [Scopulibacillus darangshiensis]|uniref:Flagellar biosynthetic protein FlhB n=1 Tax=Scopulibacillus darangshiensis TaxID=442528 RepID=A0A4R2P7W8_9BACL|nr:flagellar biosynthesis protein FlhB [Scopulibacillus darangshiensis]TCP30314.1 flagellar biosynthetic protein FlhB [Scopulibacillus darangshiensis]